MISIAVYKGQKRQGNGAKQGGSKVFQSFAATLLIV